MGKLSLNIFFLAALICSSLLTATELENTGFEYISTEHGLSQKTVQAIYQDSKGFLWFGTQEGLNRYDGKEIRVYRHLAKDIQSLSHDVVRGIAEDSNGDLWIATSGGLNRYIAENDNFERVNVVIDNQQAVSRFNTLFLDSKGILWAGSDGNGAFKIEGGGEKRTIEKFKEIKALYSADIRTIYEDSRGRLWIGTDGSGVAQISPNSHIHYTPNDDIEGAVSHSRIRSVIEDSRGRVWLGTRGGGLNRYDELTKKFITYRHDPKNDNSLAHDRVYQIFEDSFQTLWIATDGGISVFDSEHNNFIRIVHKSSQRTGLKHNRILSIYQDRGGMLWFGTLSGLNKWNRNVATFVHYRNIIEDTLSLSNNTVYSFAENSKGDVFVGTFGGGLNVLNRMTNEVSVAKTSLGETFGAKRIMALMVDREDNLWVGSLSSGVEVYSPNSEQIGKFKNSTEIPNSLSADGVTGILQDSNDDIWIATYRAGLNRLNRTNGEFKHYRADPNNRNTLASESIYNLIEGDEGFIWLATDGGGISRLDKNTDQILNFVNDSNNPQSLSGNIVSFIYQDSKGRFWIGTQGNGLNRWEPNDRRRGISKFTHYTIENGLNSSTINGIVEDESGAIWISTVKGLSRLNPETNKIEHFNLADEIHGNELNQGAVLKAMDGYLFFGGLNGVSAFYPSKVKLNSHIPPVVLTKIMSENQSLLFDKPLDNLTEIYFDHNDYLVAFEFAALDYAQPEKNRYQYKLQGFDEDWIALSNMNRATFTNLPPGSYVLKVRGSNNDGLWSGDSINLKVTVLPAPWVSWWAYSIYATIFCFMLLMVIRSQAKRLANKDMFQTQVTKRVEEKTELYVKNNEFLKEQLEQFKFLSNVDLNTGLPNQKYLCDVVKANLQWISGFQGAAKDTSAKLCIALIRLPAFKNYPSLDTGDSADKIIKTFNQQILAMEDYFKQLVRWGERELGLLGYFKDGKDCREFISKIEKQLKEILHESNEEKIINIGYSLLPFEGVKQTNIEGDNLLMLTEHFLHLIANEENINTAGIIGLNQRLNNVNFRQIMAANKLTDLSGIFILDHQ